MRDDTIYLINRLEKRIAKDINDNNLQKAINHFEGFFRYDPTCQVAHNRVGELYYQIANYIKAGKHFYFKKDESEKESDCVEIFKKSLGDDPLLILNELLYKKGYKLTGLDNYTKGEIIKLLDEIILKYAFIPKFALNVKDHFKKDDKHCR